MQSRWFLSRRIVAPAAGALLFAGSAAAIDDGPQNQLPEGSSFSAENAGGGLSLGNQMPNQQATGTATTGTAQATTSPTTAGTSTAQATGTGTANANTTPPLTGSGIAASTEESNYTSAILLVGAMLLVGAGGMAIAAGRGRK